MLIWTPAHLSKHPLSSSVNEELYADSRENNSLWYTRTAFFISELTFMVKIFTWMRASNSRWSVWKLLSSLWVQGLLVSGNCSCTLWKILSISRCPCILGISQLDYHFLCRLLTEYLKLKSSSLKVFQWTSIVSYMTDGKDSRYEHYT
jgi:hypothetical protein